ncbi:glycoside hydrolase [Amycolatopsis antarctica]|uniref:Glycoside hydrolase n=1 Tax=Amycolatopsis antarctica TaxID=1854586 RepID=A0A263D1Z0_9PSEU|nr:glycoside hydrolase family 43 protein [Amycolatopsis antarctica]OZM72098.1 glycoside hydrolase [Amycolatopsis antarctica]
MRRGIVVAVALILLAPVAPAAGAAAPVLLIDQDFADPDVVATDSGYAAYSTSSASGRIPVAQAASPAGPWAIAGDALGAAPSWADPDGGFWAPDVTPRPGGGFLMYFSAVSTEIGLMCVGVATADAATGPFTPTGTAPLICDPADNGDIDPQTHLTTDGTRYLLYKSNGISPGPPSAIWSQGLTADGLALAGPRTELLRADLPEERAVVEAPAPVRVDGGTVLFYSADEFLSRGYHTSYAVGPDLSGPFVKAEPPLLSTDGLGGAVESPGGADVVDGHIFFHGWLGGQRLARGLYVLPIRFEGTSPVLG